jgi:hypothetical protein
MPVLFDEVVLRDIQDNNCNLSNPNFDKSNLNVIRLYIYKNEYFINACPLSFGHIARGTSRIDPFESACASQVKNGCPCTSSCTARSTVTTLSATSIAVCSLILFAKQDYPTYSLLKEYTSP